MTSECWKEFATKSLYNKWKNPLNSQRVQTNTNLVFNGHAHPTYQINLLCALEPLQPEDFTTPISFLSLSLAS